MTTRFSLVRIVGFLIAVEIASGILQGYYTPLFTDIARHLAIHDADVNWFEAFQLIVSALVVPLLARLGDLYGHRRVLLVATLVTAVASWGVAAAPSFLTFLVAWSLQGFYVVWLPMEVAIIHQRTRGDERRTRSAAGLLVFFLEAGVIVGALTAGALADVLGMFWLLSIPAIAVSLALLAVWFGVPEAPPTGVGNVDWAGFGVVSAVLCLLMAGLVSLRLAGLGTVWAWLLIAAAILAAVAAARHLLRTPSPLVDLRIMSAPGQREVQVMAFLFGMSVLGAQIPLSTFARTDPATAGFGLGATAGSVSIIIGAYVLSLAVGALILTSLARTIGTRWAMTIAGALVAVGYGLFLGFHATLAQTLTNMVIAGLGSGGLVAMLPAAAAALAPPTHTGQVTGMTNTIKTVGGAIASSVYAIALASGASGEHHASLSGYLTVWGICAASALLGTILVATMSQRGTRLR